MKIAITADPEIPVPPLYYGGIERVVFLLLEGLVEQGHEVTLFANESSRVNCKHVPWPGKRSQSLLDTMLNMWVITRYTVINRYDMIHSFSRLAYLIPALLLRQKVLMTYQRYINPRNIELARSFASNNIFFSAVGQHMIKGLKGNWSIVPNGVNVEQFEYSARVDPAAPLVYLGRIEEIKGVHLAVEVAKKTKQPLMIMGNVEPEHRAYFENRIQPDIDNDVIRYIGEADDETKRKVLSNARALLMPVLWEEPFGIVMIEAMACGTPVVGLRRGAVPEIVQDRVTGFVCDSVDEMVEAVDNLDAISRRSCRRAVEKYFDQASLVRNYENVYSSAIGTRQLGG